MFGFYAYQKLVAGATESRIWSSEYFHEDWQWFFDLFNSIPLAMLGIVVCRGRLCVRWLEGRRLSDADGGCDNAVVVAVGIAFAVVVWLPMLMECSFGRAARLHGRTLQGGPPDNRDHHELDR